MLKPAYKQHNPTIPPHPSWGGIHARTGTARGGAVVQRTRVAPVTINPIISPASPILVVVKRSYTRPARVRITLRASGTVRQPATLTRIMGPLSGNIRLFESARGGTEFTFTAISSTESERTIPARELNSGKTLFAESSSACFNLDDYRLRLTLATGPLAGPPIVVNVVAVSLTLDISSPRTPPASFTPLPQPPDPRPAPGTATDKWFGGLQLATQDPGNNQERAELRATVTPGGFSGILVIRQVAVNGDNITGVRNSAAIFDDEIPGPRQLPPITETPRTTVEFDAATAAFPGKVFFVQGRNASTALRDTGFQLGIRGGESDGDRVALTMIVAPVMTVDAGIIVVKKPHTNPARRTLTVRASSAFGRNGTLTRLPGGPAIRVFNPAGNEITDLATGHVFSATQLSAGVQLSVESTVPSGIANDVRFTLALTPGGTVPVGPAATLSMTAVELTLAVGLERPPSGGPPPFMSAADKINPGRFVQLREAAFTHQRAMIVLRPPNPAISLIVVLTVSTTQVPPPANAQLQAFGPEEPFSGQAAHGSRVTFPSGLLTGGGMELFVEGTAASANVRDTGFHFGIDGLEQVCDRVVMTVLGDPSQPGPYPVGQHEYTEVQEGTFQLPIPNGGGATFTVRRRAIVRYPADPNNPSLISSLDNTYPLILILHGNHRRRLPNGAFVESYRGLEYLASHLASYGFIALSIDADDINGRINAIPQRGEAILEHLQVMIRRNAVGPVFRGKIDLGHFGLIGHSRGGEGVLSAQQINRARALGHQIRGIVSIAPTNNEDFVHNTTPYLIIYGSSDGDVSGADNSVNPFLIYDRAAPPKAMVFIYGAIHNRFSTNADWLSADNIDNDDARILSEADHQNIAKGYCTAFFERHFRQIFEFDSQFKRNGKPPSVAAVQIHHQVSEAGALVVDNFDQAPHNVDENSLVLPVTGVDLAISAEVNLGGASPPLVHGTFGGMIAWDSATGIYRSDLSVPPNGRDVSAFRVLSFRVTQRLGSARNPVNANQDFFVRLTDTANQSAVLQVSSVTTIPFPFGRHDHSVHAGPVGSQRLVDVLPDSPALSKSALKTIRLSLAAFKADNSQLNLQALRRLAFEFRQTPRGEIAIDDIEFSN